jgi:hypothetical protein
MLPAICPSPLVPESGSTTSPRRLASAGEVYQATDTTLKRQVAIKMLPALGSPRLHATPDQLCDALGACPDLHPVHRRLLRLRLKESESPPTPPSRRRAVSSTSCIADWSFAWAMRRRSGIAHRLCRLVWKILHDGVLYEERGPAVTHERRQRRAATMIRELRSLGYRIELATSLSGSPARVQMIFDPGSKN